MVKYDGRYLIILCRVNTVFILIKIGLFRKFETFWKEVLEMRRNRILSFFSSSLLLTFYNIH